MSIEPNNAFANLFFDVTSALSNVGLSTGVVIHSISVLSKIVFILLMWFARLEIIPILVLGLSLSYSFSKK